MEIPMEPIALTFSILAFIFSLLAFLGLGALVAYVFIFRPTPMTVNVVSASGDQVEFHEEDVSQSEEDDDEDEGDEKFGEDDTEWWKKKK